MELLSSKFNPCLTPYCLDQIDLTRSKLARTSINSTKLNVISHLNNRNMDTPTGSRLLEIVEDGSFWTLSDTDLLLIIKGEFLDELECLKKAYSVRSIGWKEKPGSPSKIIFPNEEPYDEVNRTLVGILALRWINNDDYEKFTCGQAQKIKLQPESFQWIRQIFLQEEIINSRSYKLYALVTSMVSNDLGKSTSFVESYLQATGDDIGSENHDMILSRAVQRGMVPSVERLRLEFRKQIKQGIKLGAEFNVGQLAQAENAPASLVPLLSMVDHQDAWHMRWMEQLLDIAGAAGHENHSCAQKLIEPILRSYRSTYDVIVGILQKRLTLREGYDQNLTTRYNLIISSGWNPPKPMAVHRPQDRALMRLFCMGNVADAQCADLFYNTFYGELVGSSIRQKLVQYLNQDGTVHKPAVQLTYGPSMMNLALSNTNKAHAKKDLKHNDSHSIDNARRRALAAMFRYFARAFAEPPSSEMIAAGDVTVIERDVRVVIRCIVESEKFSDNPDVLETALLPKDAIANRAT